MKNKKRIHRDKKGQEFIKETYIAGGKMKFRKTYIIDGIAADEYYEKNGTDLDFYLNGDYELMSSVTDITENDIEQSTEEFNLTKKDNFDDLPF